MTIHLTDLITVGLLVVLEGLLSADNALVMAVMVLGLPRRQHHQALRYGLIGGFVLRILATLLAIHLIRLAVIKLLGGVYLLYLTYQHFFTDHEGGSRHAPRAARPWLGLDAFWATVVKVELINLAFSIDSILVAVAMSPKTWVILTGGILGILALRFVVGQLLGLIQRYPALVDGAFVIIAWVGLKLILEYAHQAGFTALQIPTWFSLSVIGVIFTVAFLIARRVEARVPPSAHEVEEKATKLWKDEEGA